MTKSLQIPTDVRQLVYERDNLFCCRCGRYVGSGVHCSVHHRFPKRMGGSRDGRINDPRNLVLLCGRGNEDVNTCHGWIEQHREVAREQGWLLRSLDHLDMPLLNVYGQQVVLLADGTKVYL